MKRLAMLPVLALAVAACHDAGRTPTSVAEPVDGTSRLDVISVSIVPANAPTGTHYQAGTSASCSLSGGIVSCLSYQLAGVGNANGSASLSVSFSATVDCRNHGGQVVEVKAQAKGASASTGLLEPKNGRLAVPTLSSTGVSPTNATFEASAVCPNGNWTKEVRDGTVSLDSFVYTLNFVGYPPSYITITGP